MVLSRPEITRLYKEEKKSVQEIADMLGCSQGKINYWMQKWGIPKRTLSEATYVKRNPHGDPFSFKKPKTREESFLFGLGLGLYWGEGNKKNKTAVRLGNVDPHLILLFIRFLETAYSVPRHKFFFGLQVFSDMKAAEAERFWIKRLGVNRKQFWKTTVTPARGIGNYREKTRHGVLTVYVSNKKLRDLICTEIEKLRGMTYSA